MKKQLIALVFVFAFILTMSGCVTANAVRKLEVAEERVEEKLEFAEDKVEEKLDAVENQLEQKLAKETVPVSEPKQQPIPPAATESAQQLTKEEAQQIALNYLGFSADQVTRLRTEYEIDDGIPQYDVEFHQGRHEYEFEIHAENGKILSYDKDYD